jgi:hypothetical protein
MLSMVQDWVTALGLRHQGTLFTGVRGCDTAPKHDITKPLMRAIRFAIFVAFDPRELTEPKGFMYYNAELFAETVKDFSKNMDHYPGHFTWHAIHAIEVIGYKHPDAAMRDQFSRAYQLLVGKFHVNQETEEQMDARLTEDRIKNGTVAG